MKKCVVAAAVAALGITGLVLAPAANADVESYFDHLYQAGFKVTSASQPQVLALGEAVCLDLYGGRSLGQLMADAIDIGFTRSEGAQFIGISVANLCPQLASRVTGGEVA